MGVRLTTPLTFLYTLFKDLNPLGLVVVLIKQSDGVLLTKEKTGKAITIDPYYGEDFNNHYYKQLRNKTKEHNLFCTFLLFVLIQ